MSSEILDINVERTLKKIPRDGVKEIVTVAVMTDNTLKVFSTIDEIERAADVLVDGAFVCDPTLFEGNT